MLVCLCNAWCDVWNGEIGILVITASLQIIVPDLVLISLLELFFLQLELERTFVHVKSLL